LFEGYRLVVILGLMLREDVVVMFRVEEVDYRVLFILVG